MKTYAMQLEVKTVTTTVYNGTQVQSIYEHSTVGT